MATKNGNGKTAEITANVRQAIRCAVYTRKSTDEGLQQEFNSIDAQREAGEAFILSQRHEGWQLLPAHYDDGGYTGGNMERPALKRLLSDIDGGERPHGDHNDVSCTTCHDPHGAIGGTPGANRAMMNFDTSIAAKATTYFGYFYLGTGTGQKGCYTNCHGESHNPHTY